MAKVSFYLLLWRYFSNETDLFTYFFNTYTKRFVFIIEKLFEKILLCILLLIRAGDHKTILGLALDISNDYSKIYLMTIKDLSLLFHKTILRQLLRYVHVLKF